MDSFLQKEINEQPAVLRRFIEEEVDNVREIAQRIREADVHYAVIAARGTSDNAAIYTRYLLESFCDLPVSLAAPSIYTLYESPPSLEKALVIGISQSGEGADVNAVVEEGRRQGALTLALTNFAESPLAEAAAHTIQLRAGEEKSVAATKTYTSQLYAMAWLAAFLRQEEASQQEGKEREGALRALPDQVAAVLALQELIAARAERYRYASHLVVVGRGFNYATAFEVALKLKELTYMVAEPYSSADFRHGPIAIVEGGFPVLAIAPTGAPLDDLAALISDLEGRGAELLVVSDRQELLEKARLPLRLPVTVEEWLSPILCVLPGQLLAYHLALAKDLDPDNPRTLQKVTSTL